MTTTKMIEALHREMTACQQAARAQGYDGDDSTYAYTAEDCESIADALDALGLDIEIKNRRSLASIHSACLVHDDARSDH